MKKELIGCLPGTSGVYCKIKNDESTFTRYRIIKSSVSYLRNKELGVAVMKI